MSGLRGPSPRRALLAVLAAMALAAAGSGGSDEEASDTSSTSAPSTTTAERWQYVALGDSTHRDVSSQFEAIIEDELGVAVDLATWINPDESKHEVGGERAADLVIRAVDNYQLPGRRSMISASTT